MAITHRIEAAFGAELTANPLGWTWTDISAYALGEVVLTVGRLNEAATTNPAECQFRLKNTDGRFTPRLPGSPYYPNVRRQTPVRYSINPGTGFVQQFQGYIDAITPVWPAGNSQYAEVSVTASGSLRRLGQGTDPLKSPLRRALEASEAFVYWSLEEGPLADAYEATGGPTATSLVRLRATGPVEFGGVRPTTGTPTMPSFIRGGALQFQIRSTASSAWTVEFSYFFGSGEPAAADYTIPSAMNIFKLYAVNGDYWLFQLSPHNATFTAGRVALFRSDQPELFFDTLVDMGLGTYNPWDGQTHHVAVTASQSGADIAWQLILDGVVASSGTLAGRTLQGIDSALLNENGFLASSSTYGLGHFAVFQSVIDPTTHASAARGWTGETPAARITRLCGEEDVPVAASSTTGTATMGAQGSVSFMSLIRECETADGGILYDGDTAGLSLLSEVDRYNAPVALALDCNRAQVKLPFRPIEDDQRIANDWTLSLPGGSQVRVVDADHIATNGRYQSSGTVNLRTSLQLRDATSWRVHMGTVEEMRVSTLSLELVDHPELWADALTLRPGQRVTADHLLTQFPAGALDLVCEGYTATIDSTSWRMDINCSPAAPWNVGVLGTEALDCRRSVLGTATTASSTTIDVLVNDNCDWTHASGDYSITVGGEEMTVTAVGATTVPTPALLAVGTAASADGSATRTVTPGIPGGATAAGNLLVMFASCRDTNAVDTDMYLTGATGWKKIIDGVNFAFFAKVNSGSETAPTLNIAASIVGDTLVAQIASFSGKWGDPTTQLIASDSQLNAAAQNIAYPALPVGLGGVLLIWAGWKADDWTSVATLGGITEISEATSTAGNDAGIVWDYNNSVGVPTIASGSFVVTGGTSQISRGCVFALRTYYQTLTVTRGVNGVTRAHPVGEDVNLTDPLVLSRQ